MSQDPERGSEHSVSASVPIRAVKTVEPDAALSPNWFPEDPRQPESPKSVTSHSSDNDAGQGSNTDPDLDVSTLTGEPAPSTTSGGAASEDAGSLGLMGTTTNSALTSSVTSLPRSQSSSEDLAAAGANGGNDIDATTFFEPVYNVDASARMAGVQHITDTLRERGSEFANTHMPTVMRLATDTPYDDVRDAFCEYLNDCRTMNEEDGPEQAKFHLPADRSKTQEVSVFLSQSVVPSWKALDEDAKVVVEDIFLTTGRVSNLVRTLFYHPSYLKHWADTTLAVMYGDGPLPNHIRHYVALCAAARHGCTYLVRRQRSEFLYSGGDRKWIEGLQYAPEKLQKLAHFSTMLALRPWRLEKEHLDTLLTGSDSWSVAELVHVLVITCTYQSLASFCFAMGVVPDVDEATTADARVDEFGAAGEDHVNKEVEYTTVEEAVDLIKKLGCDEVQEGNEQMFEDAIATRHGSDSESENGKSSHAAASVSSAGDSGKASSAPASTATTGAVTTGDGSSDTHSNGVVSSCGHAPNAGAYAQFLGEFAEQRYEDFQVKSSVYEVFRVQDYSWSDDGYPLLNRFYPGVAPLLDAKFKFIYRMSYRNFGTQADVDTLPFRRAIWYYVHRVYGIFHDDYNYNEVNKILNRQIKIFIKKVTTSPEDVTRTDFVNLGYNFRPDEICHIALLTIEARQQAELLYGLRAIMKHRS